MSDDPQTTAPADNKVLVTMKGTHGSGKTTYVNAIRNGVENSGGICFLVSLDSDILNGKKYAEAVEKYTKDLKKIVETLKDNTDQFVVVIVDSCGEDTMDETVYDVDFTGWKRITCTPNYANDDKLYMQYLAWSLRNVLLRKLPSNDSTYLLNPQSVSLATCIRTHADKAQLVFKKPFSGLCDYRVVTTIPRALAELKKRADAYEKYINENFNFSTELNKLRDQILPRAQNA